MSVWWSPLERWVIDFSRGSNQNGETLIKVRKVVSLLSGVDDRSGIGGEMFQNTKRVLVTARTCTVAKNDLCADVSPKYRKIYLMDQMLGWVRKSHSNRWLQTSFLFLLKSRLIYCTQMIAVHQVKQFNRPSTNDKYGWTIWPKNNMAIMIHTLIRHCFFSIFWHAQ